MKCCDGNQTQRKPLFREPPDGGRGQRRSGATFPSRPPENFRRAVRSETRYSFVKGIALCGNINRGGTAVIRPRCLRVADVGGFCNCEGEISMLEKMDEFFEKRMSGYDEHMLNEIEGAKEFYRFTAEQLPSVPECHVLDLGCGTGLELGEYFKLNGSANVTAVDLSAAMLGVLKEKFPGKNINAVCGSYFDVPFERAAYEAAVSVESLHHFTAEEKMCLYKKLSGTLKNRGYFILTDYFAESEEAEREYRENYERLKRERGIVNNELYHYDTPLTAEHETEILQRAGFSDVRVLKSWGATFTIKAAVI